MICIGAGCLLVTLGMFDMADIFSAALLRRAMLDGGEVDAMHKPLRVLLHISDAECEMAIRHIPRVNGSATDPYRCRYSRRIACAIGIASAMRCLTTFLVSALFLHTQLLT